MGQHKYRFLSLFLAVCTLCGCLLPGVIPLAARADERPNTYINTGNQRQDLIGVALTQIGYTEGTNNKTKYGAWAATPNQPWCANFVSWCIAQAELPSEVVHLSIVSDPTEKYFNIPYYDGANYTPQPGDLFFSRIFGHVGIVLRVEGEYFYTVEGNTSVHDPENPITLEGLYVMTNKRRIKDYIFGVPRYQSDDTDHTYVKRCESAHPHNVYYECSTCGYTYHTKNTEIVESCSKCIPCACYGTTSGYYRVALNTEHLGMGERHSNSWTTPSLVPDDAIVYVYGSRDGSAYINYDNKIGHIPSYYLKAVTPVPSAPTVTANSNDYVLRDNAKIAWDLPSGTESFIIRVYKDCELLAEKNLGKTQTYELTSMDPGKYEIRVYAVNSTGASEAGRLQFVVKDVYRVSYDLRGGANGPATQSQTMRQVMTLSQTVPTRSGYTFLGWTDTADSNFVTYRPGDSFISDKDVTLYAVWKSNSATLETLSIERLPAQTQYLKGDTLNTEGLTLKLLYSDGSGQLITDGFTAEGFSSDRLGTKTITVTYGGKTVTFDVQIMTYIPGDINLDRLVNRDDVIQLLWHISFPDKFPITVPADFIDDNKVNRDDVMQLLWHVAFPDKFPLATEPQEEEDPEPTVTEPSEETTEPSTEVTEPSTETSEAPTETTETTEATEESTEASTETADDSTAGEDPSSETIPPEE